MPAAHAIEVEAEILVSHVAAKLFPHAVAVIARARRRHEIVEDRLRVRAADQAVDAGEFAEGETRRRPFARHAADGRARAERVADIEQTRGLADLEPKIAGETFIGAFAGQHHLVALPAHFAGERKQRRARGVEHRAFGGADQGGIGVGDKTRAGLDHGRTAAADGVRRLHGFVQFVQARGRSRAR